MSLGDAYADAHLDTDSLDADIAQVSAMLANAVEQWQSILNVTGTVDLDTDEATAQLEAAVAAWNGMLDENLASAVDLDTSEATAQLVSARSQWTSLLAEPIEARVQVVVEDAESIANLAATFTGIKPLLDLPVRFHIDQASVVEVTTAISGYAAVWSDALDIKVTPTVRPEGGNDLPSRPGEPARPRGPPGEPVIRPQVDETDAAVQARLLGQVLEGILKVAATIRIDGDEALADAETLAPLIERVVSTNAEVKLDGEGLIEHAEALRQLVEQTLADAQARPSLDGGVLIGQIEALAAAIDDILDVTAEPDLDEAGFRAKLIALSAEVEALVGGITVGIEPDVDPEKSVADARLIKRLIEGVLKVTVPVDMSDTEAVAQAEALKPLIDRILKITTTVDLDGAGAVAEAEAIGTLLDEALDIAMKVDFDSGGATAQAAALKATINGILRDLVINTDLDGGEATAHAVALRAVLERILGRFKVDTDLDTTGAVTHAFLLRETLNKIAGKLNVDVDIDAAGSAAKVGVLRSIESVSTRISSIFTGLSGVVGSVFRRLGAFDAIPDLLEDVARAGGVVSGVLNGIGIDSTRAFGSMTTGVSALLSAAGSVASTLISTLSSLITMTTVAGVAVAGITAAVAALNAALGSLLVAAGGLIGLAGGFATIAGGIGAAAAAAGVLGIALNKDLVQQAKDGMTVLKDSVASATREAGQHILDDFLAPYVNSLSLIARGAAQLTPLLVDPIAEAGLRYTGVINQILRSDVGASIAAKLGQGAAKFVDLFGGYLTPYSQMIDRLLGQSSGIYDIIDTILDLGLQAEPLFVSLGHLLSAIAESLGDFGSTGLPIITRIADAITNMLKGDSWKSFVDLGVTALNAILDILGQVSDGVKSVGLDSVFSVIGDAVSRLVDSGLFTTLGEVIGQLLDLGSGVLGPLVDLIASAGAAVQAFLEPLIPVVEGFVTVFADQLAATIDSLVDDGTIGALAEALGEIINILTLLLPGLAQLIQLLGPGLTVVLKALSLLLVSIGVAWYTFTGGIIDALGSLLDAFGKALGFMADAGHAIVDILGSVPAPILDQIVPGMSTFVGAIGDGADMLDHFSGVVQAGGAVMGMAADEAYMSATKWAVAGSAAQRAGLAVEASNKSLAGAIEITDDYSDVLGVGADAVAKFGDEHGYTTEQIRAAADAAAAAAVQFQNTTKLVNEMREWASKPIALSFDFDKTKLDLNSLVNYVDATVKTTQEKVGNALYADPGAQDLAAGVIGADGSNLAGLTSQTITTETFVPAHLETSVMDSITELMDNLDRDIANKNYLTALEFNGFSDLADQLREFDGPKLELAIQELGDVGSAKVREANEKLKEAQRKADEGFNPLQESIDSAKKGFIEKARQVQIVAELEKEGLSNLASQFASLKPEDLEAAIRTYDTLGGVDSPVVKSMEDQLVQLRDAGEKFATEIDPIGKMFQAAQNTPGARQGLIGKVFTGEELDFLGSDQGEAFYNTAVKKAEQLAAMAGQKNLPPALAALADRWKKVFSGTLGENDAPMTDLEAKIVAASDYHKLLAQGGSVDPVTGEVTKGTAGVAEATDAGKAVANAFATAMTGTDGSKIVEDAANGMVTSGVSSVLAAAQRLGGVLTQTGLDMVKLVSGGITAGGVLYLGPAIVVMLASVIEIIDTALSSGHEMVSIGRLMTITIALGVTAGAASDLYPAVLVMVATIADIIESGLSEAGTLIQAKASDMVGRLALGIDVAVPDVAVSLVKLGSMILTLLAATQAESAEAAFMTGSAVIDGITLGMMARLPDLIAAATVIALTISTVLRTAMQVSSPSKVTTSIGEQIAEGLAVGLESSHDRVAGAARALTGTLGANLSMPEIPAARLAAGDTPYPPSVTAGRPDTLEAVQAFAAARTANVAPPPSNGAETGGEGGWRGRGRPAGREGAFIHADVVNINGVPGAAEIPARTRAGFWRLNYGENTTRGTE